jgi:cysteinyl-tRNA synthetase
VAQAIETGIAAFDEALADDLNMERAMAAVLELVSQLNQLSLAPADGKPVQAALESLDQVLDVLVRRRMGMIAKDRLAAAALSAEETAAAQAAAGTAELDDALVETLILARQSAKKRKDFATADGIRTLLKERGILIEDLPTGVRWKTA